MKHPKLYNAHIRGESAAHKALEKKKDLGSRKLVKKERIPEYPGIKSKSFIDRLEEHKRIGQSFDNGKWKPRYKGQSFIDAIEEHKRHSADEFI